MSKPRHITVDSRGNIYPIAEMFDRFANDTKDPALAVSVVINLGCGWHSATADDVPIYTVH